jgi:hypothetical protein
MDAVRPRRERYVEAIVDDNPSLSAGSTEKTTHPLTKCASRKIRLAHLDETDTGIRGKHYEIRQPRGDFLAVRIELEPRRQAPPIGDQTDQGMRKHDRHGSALPGSCASTQLGRRGQLGFPGSVVQTCADESHDLDDAKAEIENTQT